MISYEMNSANTAGKTTVYSLNSPTGGAYKFVMTKKPKEGQNRIRLKKRQIKNAQNQRIKNPKRVTNTRIRRISGPR
ncbi:MAG: hypothetical protein JW755_02965 [Candidatus Aminicenantes bacterium]|nr:hypothetical protein [Candidatus Aminicenantes bacterium]